MRCFHKFCTNSSRKQQKAKFSNLSFFRFPRNEQVRNKWLEFCGLPLNTQVLDTTRLCSLHFDHNDLYSTKIGGKILKQSAAVPVFPLVVQMDDVARLEDEENHGSILDVDNKKEMHALDFQRWNFKPIITLKISNALLKKNINEFKDVNLDVTGKLLKSLSSVKSKSLPFMPQIATEDN